MYLLFMRYYMTEKNSMVQEQYKITIPKEIRADIDVKVGTIAKWVTKIDSLKTGEVTITFINV